MLRKTSFGLIIALAATVVACGPKEAPPEEQAAAARANAFAELKSQHDALNAQRQTVSDLAARLAAATAGESEEEVDIDALNSEIETAAADIDNATAEFGESVVVFINSDPPVEGEPLNETQRAAFDLKADEDLLIAREYIEKGGDYARAISIIEGGLRFDSENETLKQALASAQEMRFMTEERFTMAKKGMTEAEVREVLGPVNLYNVQVYEDKGVTAWFYPKDKEQFPDAAPSAVYFRKKGGENRAYELKWDAK